MNHYLAAFSVLPSLLLSQLPFAPKGSQPELNQRLTMYSKPAVVRILAGCSGTYTYTSGSSEYTFPFLSGGVGSGYFVDPNGYIVTNAHVINLAEGGEAACKERLFENLVKKVSGESDIKAVPQGSKDNLRRNSELKDFTYANHVILPNGESFKFEVKERGLPVVEEGRTDIGKDVAVIKIEVTNAPVLKLGDSSSVQIQEPVVVLGYPGTADVTSVLSDKSMFEASALDGKVANTNKTLQNGSPVLQLNVTVAPGSSGGPVLNQRGEVIGMITFGGSGYDEETSFPYAVPTNTILEFTRKSGAANEEGSTGPLYRQGLDLFWQNDFDGAKTKFEAVQGLFPQHSEVVKLLKISEQKLAEQWENKSYVPLVAGIAVAIAGLVGSYFLVRRKTAFATQPAIDTQMADSLETGQNYPRPQRSNLFQPQTLMSFGRSQPATVAMTQAFLELKNSQGQERRFYLKGDRHQLGRDRTWADLKIPDQGWEVLSKHQAMLQREGKEYRVYDGDGQKASTNGIVVNGTRIDSEGHLLQDGDRLQIGQDPHNQVTITYFHPNGNSSAAARSDMNSRA